MFKWYSTLVLEKAGYTVGLFCSFGRKSFNTYVYWITVITDGDSLFACTMKGMIMFVVSCLLLGGCQSTGTTSIDNQKVDVAYLKLHIAEKDYTLLYFWTTWCGPCRKAFKETLPQIEGAIDETKSQLITIAVSKDDKKIAEISEVAGLKANNLKLGFIGPDLYLNHKRVLENALEDLFQDQKVWRNSVPVFILVNRSGHVIDAKLPKDIQHLIDLLDEKGIINQREDAVIASKGSLKQ